MIDTAVPGFRKLAIGGGYRRSQSGAAAIGGQAGRFDAPADHRYGEAGRFEQTAQWAQQSRRPEKAAEASHSRVYLEAFNTPADATQGCAKGRFLLSGAQDQTLCLWNLKTRELLVTIFHSQDGEWAMWTPHGHYVSTPDGDRMIGWQINRGPEREADYVRASQLARHLFRPDIIARTIERASAEAALRELGADADILDLLRTGHPPEFRILLPQNLAKMPYTPASVIVEAAPNPDKLEPFEITVNGRQVATRDLHFLASPDARPVKKILKVPLEQGDNGIRISTRNRIGTASRELRLHFQGVSPLDKRGTLYVVAVGVDDYMNSTANSLRFAGADARAFCEVMLNHVTPLHERTECLLLAKGGDKEPTRANIENAMLVNGGAISGRRGGVKVGQLRCWCFEAKSPLREGGFLLFGVFQDDTSPVSGSTASAGGGPSPAGSWPFRRRFFDCLSR